MLPETEIGRDVGCWILEFVGLSNLRLYSVRYASCCALLDPLVNKKYTTRTFNLVM